MNPEDNNPLTNPATPSTTDNFGMAPNGAGQLSTDDRMASAENTLTSAGMAAGPTAQTMDLGQVSATQPEAIMAPPMEEPLVPAAPVPGSIGSVTSVPPVGAAPMTPEMPGMADGGVNAAPLSTPEAASQMPYNPFAPNNANPAQPATSAEPTLPPTNPAVAVKASKKPKLSRPANLPLLLAGGLAAILLVTTIIFFVLWRQAVNNPKIVYVPSTSGDEVTASIRLLSCSHENDYDTLIGYGQPVMGTESVVASYTSDTLQGLSLTNQASFNSPEDASTARDNFAYSQQGFVDSLGSSFEARYNVDGNTMNAVVESKNGQLNPTDAMMFIYGTVEGNPSTAMSDVQAHYEAAGFVCSVE